MLGQVAPLAVGCIEFDVHDAYALQAGNFKTKILAHAANLSVETLCKDDAKATAPNFFNHTRTCNGIENRNAG